MLLLLLIDAALFPDGGSDCGVLVVRHGYAELGGGQLPLPCLRRFAVVGPALNLEPLSVAGHGGSRE